MAGTSRPRLVPWGMIGASVLIVGVEHTISKQITSVTTEVAACWGFAGKAANREAVHADVLGFGDSLMKYGFQPQVIEARTGRTAYNLAVYGGPPSFDYLLLKRVLDAGGNPSALVVCFQVVHMWSGPRYHARHFAEVVRPREALDLALSTQDPGLFAWMMLARSVPSIRTRFEIRGNLMTALNGDAPNWASAFANFRRNWNHGQGAHVQTEKPNAPEDKAAVARARELYPTRFEDLTPSNPIHEQYIRRFLDLAAERNIPVLWVLPPMLPELEARQKEVNLVALTEDLAGRVRAAYPNVTVVDGRGRDYEASAFCQDAVHLNRIGANALSRDLADILRHRLGDASPGPSWVTLPKYRPGPLEANLEDMAHSVLAVSQARRMRR